MVLREKEIPWVLYMDFSKEILLIMSLEFLKILFLAKRVVVLFSYIDCFGNEVAYLLAKYALFWMIMKHESKKVLS